MTRTPLLMALLVMYMAAAVRLVGISGAQRRLDAMAPQPRVVERAIEEHRFVDALPVALELRDAYPKEALVPFWLATIFHGLDRPADEAAAWEDYVGLSSVPAEACPAIAEAYARLGDQTRALHEYERCVTYDPHEPDRLVDLGEAYERARELEPALGAYRRAATLDPHDPAISHQIDRLSRLTHGQ